jgi:hypothetical protein
MLEVTFFDVKNWRVKKKEFLPGYVINSIIRGLPLTFRNGIACFFVYEDTDYNGCMVFVSKDGVIGISDPSPFLSPYSPPPTVTFDGKILISTGNRIKSFGSPGETPPKLIVKEAQLWNGDTLLSVDFGEDILLLDNSLISLTGTVSGDIEPLTINESYGLSRLYIENLTLTTGETLTLTINPGAISGDFTNNQIVEPLIITVEVV